MYTYTVTHTAARLCRTRDTSRAFGHCCLLPHLPLPWTYTRFCLYGRHTPHCTVYTHCRFTPLLAVTVRTGLRGSRFRYCCYFTALHFTRSRSVYTDALVCAALHRLTPVPGSHHCLRCGALRAIANRTFGRPDGLVGTTLPTQFYRLDDGHGYHFAVLWYTGSRVCSGTWFLLLPYAVYLTHLPLSGPFPHYLV